jgi:hypothetical protein
MPIKYQLTYRDHYNNAHKVDISHDAYTGAIIPLTGVAGQACIIDREADSEDPYEPIITTKATINILQSELLPEVDVFELQVSEDREFSVTYTINDEVRFTGWINPDGLQRPLVGSESELALTATDGLQLLNDIPYIHNNLDGGRNIINYFRQILLAIPNLNSSLPIRWYNKLVNSEYFYESDVFSGSIWWSSRGEGYTDTYGQRKDCMFILSNMLRSMQCRIIQSEGYWTIYRINDLIDDAGNLVIFKNISGLTGFTIMDSDYYIPLKTINDNHTASDYKFIEDDHVITVMPALKRVITTYEQTQRDNILPNGNMDLFVFGSPLYWELLTDGTATMTQSNNLSDPGDAESSSITIRNNGAANATFQLGLGALPIDTDVLYTYINFGFKFCINAGAVIDSNGIIQWGENGKLVIDVIYTAGATTYYLNEFGFWTANPTLIQLEIPNLKMGDVAQIDFNAHQDIAIPLPAVSPIGRTSYPEINVRFYVQENVEIMLDDIYIKTDNNSDVYEASVDGSTKNTAKGEYTLGISSSHNGFYLSNYMTSYNASGLEKFYQDGDFEGTLTELNSRAILRNRHLPSLMFEGSIYGSDYMFAEMYSIQGFEGKKFLPLRSSWNTETNTVRLTAIESRNENVGMSVSHYGSNEKTKLSN